MGFLFKDKPSFFHTVYLSLIHILCLLAMAPFTGGFAVTIPSLGGILVLALVCTLGGHALMTYLLGFVSADVVSFALLGEPIGAAVWALVLFGEQVTLPLLIGGITVIVGLAMYTLSLIHI